jgi:TfoX/Sxy family transcriptional regulator of competence genes
MQMAKADSSSHPEKVALFDKLVATHPAVKRKGATMPYTSVNGNMFSVLHKDGKLALRLPEEARAAFLRKYSAKLSVQYGVVLKEYVEVPDSLLQNTRELKRYFDASYAYALSLKPKPTRRKPAVRKTQGNRLR